METVVKIKWDEPSDKNWLCPDNIKTALSAYCTNTKFEVSEVDSNLLDAVVMPQLNASESLFGFCGWLTTRDEQTIMSAKDNCSRIVELIKKFQEVNNLPEVRDGWENNLTHPKE
jgi:hypothetical protein